MKPYRPEPKIGKEAFGHIRDCPWRDNTSPACNCDHAGGSAADDHKRALAISDAMAITGWTPQGEYPWKSFSRRVGPHNIMVSRVPSGWQYLWFREGWTLFEKRGFGTIAACLEDMWEQIALRMDRYQDLCMDAARQAVKESG